LFKNARLSGLSLTIKFPGEVVPALVSKPSCAVAGFLLYLQSHLINNSSMNDEKFLGISIETTCVVLALKEVLINTPELQEKFIKIYEGFKSELLSKATPKDDV
jgi:hypothetical protein